MAGDIVSKFLVGAVLGGIFALIAWLFNKNKRVKREQQNKQPNDDKATQGPQGPLKEEKFESPQLVFEEKKTIDTPRHSEPTGLDIGETVDQYRKLANPNIQIGLKGLNKNLLSYALIGIVIVIIAFLYISYSLKNKEVPEDKQLTSIAPPSQIEEAERCFNEGQKQYSNGNYADAISAYNKAINLGRQDRFVYLFRGMAHMELGNYENAIMDFSGIIAKSPDDAIAYSMRGQAYAALNNYFQAIADYDKSLTLNPRGPEVVAEICYNRGLVYINLSKYREAIKDFDVALELNPKLSSGFFYRGYSYLKLGIYQQAIKDFQKKIELKPNDPAAYTNIGTSQIALGKYAQAIKECSKAIELDPRYAFGYSVRGLAYAKINNFSKAMNDLNKAIDLDPKLGSAYSNLGFVYLKLGNSFEANRNIEIAARLGDRSLLDYLEMQEKQRQLRIEKAKKKYGEYIPKRR
jgi:tetratricopeptide (TPR) repeat protein